MKLEHVGCDLCGSEDYRVRYRKPDNWLWLNLYEYPVVACAGCGLVYVNPRPTFEEMGHFYPKGYHDGRDDASHRLRYQAQFEYVAAFAGEKVLDIGCACGDWLGYLQEKWPESELYGVDAFSNGVNNPGIRFRKGVLPEVDLPTASFDLITAWAVFEHVHTPDTYFAAVGELLKPGGKFVLLVTNAESVYGKHAYKEDIPRHLYHFSEGSLRRYAEKHGMRLDALAYDERFWDGSGKGAFHYGMARLAGITWRDIYIKRLNYFHKMLLRFGSALDIVAFCCHWEARARRSGIIVASLSKS
jgi:SAM-dependent methyltransferase